MLIHTIFDILAWLSAALLARWISRLRLLEAYVTKRTLRDDPGYYLSLALGALAGAYLSGSLNLSLAQIWTLGHSIAGAIAGGIVAVELYKLARDISGSTGLVFVGPLALGIAVGRLGCFFAGLPDYTYGTPTSLPWGVDFGDGIHRHPVQLYESAAMLMFLVTYLAALRTVFENGGGGATTAIFTRRRGERGEDSPQRYRDTETLIRARFACARKTMAGGDRSSPNRHASLLLRASAPPREHSTSMPEASAVKEIPPSSPRGAWQDYFLRNSFYLFVGWYALQRFAWEFLKPYPPVVGPFNIFHLICAALLCYSLFMLRGRHELRAAV